MRNLLAACLMTALLPLTAFAEDAPKDAANPETPGTPPCINHQMTQNSITVSYSGQADTLAEAQNKLATQKKALEAETKKIAGEPKLTLNNSYSDISLTTNSYTPTAIAFTYSGGTSYTAQDEETAQKLINRFSELKWIFSYSSTSSRCD